MIDLRSLPFQPLAGSARLNRYSHERGATLIETAIVILPCLFSVLIFVILAEGLYSTALVTSDAVMGRLGREVWNDVQVSVDQLMVGHPDGVRASITLPTNPEDTRRALLFANIVAGEAVNSRHEAFGFAPGNDWSYRQTTCEYAMEQRPIGSSVNNGDATVPGPAMENVVWEKVTRRFMPAFLRGQVTASIGSILR